MAFPNKESVPKELVYMQMVQESCIFKVALSGVAGFALGGLFGMFMSSFEMTSTDPAIYEQPMKQQLKATAKDMAKRSFSMAKNFAVVGAIFSGTECVIEGYRAKNDIYNGTAAGCITGALLAAKAGPQATLIGCAGFAAFSTAIDLFMRREVDT
ncbi:3660_t:CDS:2, partial [Scutellospora calospora]